MPLLFTFFSSANPIIFYHASAALRLNPIWMQTNSVIHLVSTQQSKDSSSQKQSKHESLLFMDYLTNAMCVQHLTGETFLPSPPLFFVLRQPLTSQGYQLYSYATYSDLHHLPWDLFSLMESWEENMRYVSLSNLYLWECVSLNNANKCNYKSRLIDWAAEGLGFLGVLWFLSMFPAIFTPSQIHLEQLLSAY